MNSSIQDLANRLRAAATGAELPLAQSVLAEVGLDRLPARVRKRAAPGREPRPPWAVSAAGLYIMRTKPELVNFAAVEVEAVPAAVQTAGSASAGTPILTASGYLVARHQSVISSKIQGRLSGLYVEEGSYVKTGEVIARLEDTDYKASIVKAQADVDAAIAAAKAS